MDDLKSRLANRVQLTSDGHKAYLEAVEGAFGADVAYAQLVKLYGLVEQRDNNERSGISAKDIDTHQRCPVDNAIDDARCSSTAF